jgi:uncharacterized membrane protein
MRYLYNFIPARQGLIIGAAVGIATKNIVVGIIIILMFSFASYVKSIKS